jgi:hypothetical protein
MKLIATKISTPFEKEAFELYEAEFSNREQGFVLFPEGSIEYESLSEVYILANKYKIGVIGTVKEHTYQRAVAISNNKLNIGPISYSGESLPNMNYMHHSVEELIAPNGEIAKFYKEDQLLNFKVGSKEFNSIVRICSDIALPYARKDIANLLLIPSAIEHPSGWFNQQVSRFKNNLTKDAKIIYSPSEMQPTVPKSKHTSVFDNIQIGIYDIHLNQLGKVKENYVVLDIK